MVMTGELFIVLPSLNGAVHLKIIQQNRPTSATVHCALPGSPSLLTITFLGPLPATSRGMEKDLVVKWSNGGQMVVKWWTVNGYMLCYWPLMAIWSICYWKKIGWTWCRRFIAIFMGTEWCSQWVARGSPCSDKQDKAGGWVFPEEIVMLEGL